MADASRLNPVIHIVIIYLIFLSIYKCTIYRMLPPDFERGVAKVILGKVPHWNRLREAK